MAQGRPSLGLSAVSPQLRDSPSHPTTQALSLGSILPIPFSSARPLPLGSLFLNDASLVEMCSGENRKPLLTSLQAAVQQDPSPPAASASRQ